MEGVGAGVKGGTDGRKSGGRNGRSRWVASDEGGREGEGLKGRVGSVVGHRSLPSCGGCDVLYAYPLALP